MSTKSTQILESRTRRTRAQNDDTQESGIKNTHKHTVDRPQ